MDVTRLARFWATVISRALLFALAGTLVAFIFLTGAELRPGAGVSTGVLDTVKWAAVAALGLASMCFSFYRTFSEPGEKALMKVVRAAGARFVIAAVLLLVALAVGVTARELEDLPGATTDPPIDQIVLPVIMLIFGGAAAALAAMALTGLLEVALTTSGQDDPRPLTESRRERGP